MPGRAGCLRVPWAAGVAGQSPWWGTLQAGPSEEEVVRRWRGAGGCAPAWPVHPARAGLPWPDALAAGVWDRSLCPCPSQLCPLGGSPSLPCRSWSEGRVLAPEPDRCPRLRLTNQPLCPWCLGKGSCDRQLAMAAPAVVGPGFPAGCHSYPCRAPGEIWEGSAGSPSPAPPPAASLDPAGRAPGRAAPGQGDVSLPCWGSRGVRGSSPLSGLPWGSPWALAACQESGCCGGVLAVALWPCTTLCR